MMKDSFLERVYFYDFLILSVQTCILHEHLHAVFVIIQFTSSPYNPHNYLNTSKSLVLLKNNYRQDNIDLLDS